MSGAAGGQPPLGNRIVLALLRSRWHRLLSGSVAQLTVRGRRSGRILRLPVQYAREADKLVLLPGHVERKRWWRNLVTGAPVSVLLARREHAGHARVVRAGTPAFRDALTTYSARFPKAAQAAASSVLVAVNLHPLDRAVPAAPSGAARSPGSDSRPAGCRSQRSNSEPRRSR